MSLLAESLVEEWLNRDGYFTVRGARFGVSEMDLLAVRQSKGRLEGRHIEVQVSTNPIAYISPLTRERAKQLDKEKTSAWTRTPEILEESVAAWVEKKFRAKGKVKARARAWSGLDWSFELVHGKVKHVEELALVRANEIKTIPFHSVLRSLCLGGAVAHKGGAGSDIADILAYFIEHRETAA